MPEDYSDEKVSDPLFLPATHGIFNASKLFLPHNSNVTVVRRSENLLEMTHRDEAHIFSDQLREKLGFNISVNSKGERKRREEEFITSYLLVQILLRDPSLRLTAVGVEEKISSGSLSNKKRVDLLEQFFSYLEKLAKRNI
jgi:hypothetical protein